MEHEKENKINKRLTKANRTQEDFLEKNLNKENTRTDHKCTRKTNKQKQEDNRYSKNKKTTDMQMIYYDQNKME